LFWKNSKGKIFQSYISMLLFTCLLWTIFVMKDYCSVVLEFLRVRIWTNFVMLFLDYSESGLIRDNFLFV
jgi:hypothetical protein